MAGAGATVRMFDTREAVREQAKSIGAEFLTVRAGLPMTQLCYLQGHKAAAYSACLAMLGIASACCVGA